MAVSFGNAFFDVTLDNWVLLRVLDCLDFLLLERLLYEFTYLGLKFVCELAVFVFLDLQSHQEGDVLPSVTDEY